MQFQKNQLEKKYFHWPRLERSKIIGRKTLIIRAKGFSIVLCAITENGNLFFKLKR